MMVCSLRVRCRCVCCRKGLVTVLLKILRYRFSTEGFVQEQSDKFQATTVSAVATSAELYCSARLFSTHAADAPSVAWEVCSGQVKSEPGMRHQSMAGVPA